jgi:hypothetical protein
MPESRVVIGIGKKAKNIDPYTVLWEYTLCNKKNVPTRSTIFFKKLCLKTKMICDIFCFFADYLNLSVLRV